MGAPASSINPLTNSVGFNIRLVTVTQVDPSQGIALAVDEQNVQVTLSLAVQRAKGLLPAEGELWIIDQALGFWSFAAYVAPSVSGYTLKVDTWHPLILQNGWVNSTVVGDPVSSYQKTPSGGVFLSGLVKNGTSADGTTIATLPVGYRSVSFHTFPVYVGKTPAAGTGSPAILVYPTGEIQIFGASAGGSTATVMFNFTLPLDV